MKKLFLLSLILLPMVASAGYKRTYDAKVGKIYYKFDDTDRTAMVTYMLYDSRGNGGAYSGDVVIPSSVRYNNVTYSVTAIDRWAFLCCGGVTSVSIPSSITSIADGAFEECGGLKAVYISDLESWCNISLISRDSNPLYYAHHLYLNGELIKDLVIPNGVKAIGQYAFYDCSDLTYITIPNSVTSIGSDAFYNSGWYNNQPDGLVYAGKVAYKYKGTMPDNTSIIIKDGTQGIAGSAFLGCSGLTSITIPNSVTNIGNQAFQSCRGLTSVTIPSSVTSIGWIAFSGCNSLTSVTIPNSVTAIGIRAFSDCSSLNSIIVESGNIKYDSRENCNGIIETETNMLVLGCKKTTIPNSVTSVGEYAFYGCRGLTSIMIPNSVTSIGQYAFSDCYSLASMIIPNSVTSIGSYSFMNCSSLKYVCLTSEELPSMSILGNVACQVIIPYKAYKNGIPQGLSNYATYNDKPMFIRVKSKTATSALLELRPVDTTNGGFKGNNIYTVTLHGLVPATSISTSWKVDPFGSGIVSFLNDKTNSLVMEVQPAKALNTTKARLSATVNEANDDKRYGFEWLRYDAPDNMTPNRVSAPLYDGQIIGTLSNLNPDIYYKYRPFYKADDGTIIRGEWEAFITGDANVFFEPEVHTNEPVALTKDGAQLSGVWVEGTEDIQEKGFEYWLKNSSTRPASATRGSDVTAVIVKGNDTSITLDGLEPGTEYVYRSYMKTLSGTTYGEEVTFKTPLPGDANNDGKINVADIVEINNAKAGNPSASFNMTNADTDDDGSLTEADITAIVNIIMKR